jgi:hypothetical protein
LTGVDTSATHARLRLRFEALSKSRSFSSQRDDGGVRDGN